MFFLRHLFLTFFLFALAEAVLLAKVGTAIGWGVTIALIVLTALIGSMMFRSQGLMTLTRLNQRMAQGEMPGQEMLEGVLILLGGALLMTPGFLTDAIGFVFLISPSRRSLAAWMISKGLMQAVMKPGGTTGEQVWVYQQRSYHYDNARPGTWQGGVDVERDVTAQATVTRTDPVRHPSSDQQGTVIEGDFQVKGQDQSSSQRDR